MLAADKLQLQSALKQQATALKEKEFNLHHSNMSEFCQSFTRPLFIQLDFVFRLDYVILV